jgi:hypothetical protein
MSMVLAVLLRMDEVPDDVQPGEPAVREYVEIHRSRDFRRARNVSPLKSMFRASHLKALVGQFPKVVTKRALVRYLRPFSRVQLGQIANEFSLQRIEAQAIVCELVRAGAVNMVVDTEGGMVLKIDRQQGDVDRRGIFASICGALKSAEAQKK